MTWWLHYRSRLFTDSRHDSKSG